MFGGVPFPVPTNRNAFKNTWPLVGLTLSANIGAPNPAAADTGEIVTGVPGPGQVGLPATFGRGRGNWTFDDFFAMWIDINCPEYGAPVGGANGGPDVYNAFGSVTPDGNLIFLIHNRGVRAADSGGMFIKVRYDHSAIR